MCYFVEDFIKYAKILNKILNDNEEMGFRIAKAIVKLREKHNISQEKMAKMIKINPKFLNKCEKNEINFPPLKLFRICHILKIDIEDFLILINPFLKI